MLFPGSTPKEGVMLWGLGFVVWVPGCFHLLSIAARSFQSALEPSERLVQG